MKNSVNRWSMLQLTVKCIDALHMIQDHVTKPLHNLLSDDYIWLYDEVLHDIHTTRQFLEKELEILVLMKCKSLNVFENCQYTLKTKVKSPRGYSVDSFWPSDALWQHEYGSTVAQVMACSLTAPSHYLNQCWLIINHVQRQSPGGNFTRNTSVISY